MPNLPHTWASAGVERRQGYEGRKLPDYLVSEEMPRSMYSSSVINRSPGRKSRGALWRHSMVVPGEVGKH